jgi:hypothetical protein
MRNGAFTIEEIHSPDTVARCRSQDERARRNSAWLQAHWAELLLRARGKLWPARRPSSRTTQRERGPWPVAPTPTMTAPSANTCFPKPGRGSMVISGEWRIGDDGVPRPVVRGKVLQHRYHVELE